MTEATDASEDTVGDGGQSVSEGAGATTSEEEDGEIAATAADDDADDVDLLSAPPLDIVPLPMYEAERVGSVYDQLAMTYPPQQQPPTTQTTPGDGNIGAYEETTEVLEDVGGINPYAGVGGYGGYGYGGGFLGDGYLSLIHI